MENLLYTDTFRQKINLCKKIVIGILVVNMLQFVYAHIFVFLFSDRLTQMLSYYAWPIIASGLGLWFGFTLYKMDLPKFKVAGIYWMGGWSITLLCRLIDCILLVSGASGGSNPVLNLFLSAIVPTIALAAAVVSLMQVSAIDRRMLMNVLLIWVVNFATAIAFSVNLIIYPDFIVYYFTISYIISLISFLCSVALIFCWWKALTPAEAGISDDVYEDYTLSSPWQSRVMIGFVLSLAIVTAFAIAGCLIGKIVIQ